MKKIGIIGVGKLGLVYALTFEKFGYHVWASSYKKEYVQVLQKKEIDSSEPGVAQMLTESKNIVFTVDNHEVINHCDIIYIMVSTPSLPSGEYDISAVLDVVQDFINHDKSVAGKILIVGSTVNPGTCVMIQQKIDPLRAHVVYSPTYAAQGTVVQNIASPTAISFGAFDDSVAQICLDAFSPIIPQDTKIHRLHPTTAEILKLVGNCYVTLRINFYNIMGQLLISSGLEHEIEKANQYLGEIETRKNNLKFGFGYGGPCFPRDNRSLQFFSEHIGIKNRFAEINDLVNTDHAEFLTEYFLHDNHKKLPFCFESISYKPGVKIFEESQQLRVCENLLGKGSKVVIKSSVFLDLHLVDFLKNKYPGQIELMSSSQIDKHRQLLYNIPF